VQAATNLLSGSSYVTIQAATPPPDLAASSYGPAGPHSGTAHGLQHPQSQQPASSLHGSTLHATVNDHRHIQEQRAHQATQISALPCPSPTRTSVHTAVAAAMQQCCLYFWTTLTTWLRIQAAFKAPSLGTGLSALLLGSTALSAKLAIVPHSMESLPGHCDLLDSGHWQDMLTGKHDLLCKQLPPVWIKLRHARAYTAPTPQAFPCLVSLKNDNPAGPHT
jgi:hypothetical protein